MTPAVRRARERVIEQRDRLREIERKYGSPEYPFLPFAVSQARIELASRVALLIGLIWRERDEAQV